MCLLTSLNSSSASKKQKQKSIKSSRDEDVALN